jgi:hypothetical protein
MFKSLFQKSSTDEIEAQQLEIATNTLMNRVSHVIVATTVRTEKFSTNLWHRTA